MFLAHVLCVSQVGLALLHFAFIRDPRPLETSWFGDRGEEKGTGHMRAQEYSAGMWPGSCLHILLVREVTGQPEIKEARVGSPVGRTPRCGQCWSPSTFFAFKGKLPYFFGSSSFTFCHL